MYAVADMGYVITAQHWPATPTDGVFTEIIDTQITQAEYDQIQSDAAQAEHEAIAPDVSLESWSKMELFNLRMHFEIAKLANPSIDWPQFETFARARWDEVQ